MLGRCAEFVRRQCLAAQRVVLQSRSLFANFFYSVPQRMMPRSEARRAYPGLIVDLFATILRHVKGMAPDDMDSTLDILRYNFPNVEHSWIIRRFENAYKACYPLEAALTLAAAKRSEPEKLSLALEIYSILHRVGGKLSDSKLFDKVCQGLKIPTEAQTIEEFFAKPDAPVPKLVESITFGASAEKDDEFTLSPSDSGKRFRALRCVNLLLIINDGEIPLRLRGRDLSQGSIMPLMQGQDIELQATLLTYDKILYLLQAKYTGIKTMGYLVLEDDELSIERQRSRASLARVYLGLRVEIEILKKNAEFKLEGELLDVGMKLNATYFNTFTIKGHGPYQFNALREHASRERSLQLAPGNRTILVTNLASTNRVGALMLTTGLAPSSVFEVSYSKDSNKGTLRLLEGGSSLMVNDSPVRDEITELNDGDRIRLSSIQSLRCRFAVGVLEEESSTISQLSVEGLTKDYSRAGRVVDNIDFSLISGEMACIIGPSGSGKSTLLSLLAGHLRPSFGRIHYNGERMFTHSLNLRSHIAYIPREDILDEAMTVSEHIYQASIIRRPKLNNRDRRTRTMAVLSFLGLGHLASRNVGRAGERSISDGERTRVNLGLDLTGTAEVFLIDEPISGLSSADSERVIQTLINMSEGRILLCTLHRPTVNLLQKFKKIMVLDAHGQMAFWGSPTEMVNYFKEAAKEMKLHISPEAELAGGADYVLEVLEAPSNRILGQHYKNAHLWQERYESYDYRRTQSPQRSPISEAQESKLSTPIQRNIIEQWRIFYLWLTRTFLGRVRSRMGLYALLLEGPVLALLISGTLRCASDVDYTYYKALHINEFLFLSLVLAMFFGLTDAACEILRDRPLLRRESNYKLFTTGYLLSKVLVLTGIAAVQCALYLWVSNLILKIEYMFWLQMSVMVLTAFIGISLSLFVSAFVRSERTALNIIPLLLVPQILLAGALVKFEYMNEFTPDIPDGILPAVVDKKLSLMRHRVAYQDTETHDIMTKPVPLIAEFCPLRYSFEMLFLVQTTQNRWNLEMDRINKRREELKETGSKEDLRFIQRAVLTLNAPCNEAEEANDLLRRSRKAALGNNEEFLEIVIGEQKDIKLRPDAQPLEFFFTNRKMVEVSEGVNTARKDARLQEGRGFYLAPRQARPFSEIEQSTDENSVDTIWRNGIYLFLMGLVPILLTAWKLKRMMRGSSSN
ncbi:MAG: ATP-binding cassette domain-containing protein [Akkermansia sp.]